MGMETGPRDIDEKGTAADGTPFVRLVGVSKSFSGVTVLQDINIDFQPGVIHALVGENGAGKSTVGKIVGGYYSRSSGGLEVFGQSVGNWTPPLALEQGIAMMHQELQLVPDLTVAQNVFLGIEHNRGGFLRRNENARLSEIVALAGFDLDPSAKASSLSIADQQKVEIMRALARDARVIVMDEPTSSLTADEADRLHAVMRRLRERGHTIIYVSHFLDHVLAVSDTVTVMRDGAVIRTAPAAEETKASLVTAMLGRAAAEVAFPELPPEPDRSGTPLLSLRNISTDSGLKDVSLDLYPGEILGLVGLVGSGRTEIARAIFGADPALSGDVLIDGAVYDRRSPHESIRRKLAMVPEDRRGQGLVLTQTVRPNMTLPYLDAFSRFGLMRGRQEKARVREFIDYLNVNPPQVDGWVANYSGGNQQKVVLGKWIMSDPRIVILDDPSRGVDIGARRRIHDFIGDIAKKGAGVIVISSEIEEVMGLAHRACVVSGGRIIGEFRPSETTVDAVLWDLFQDHDDEGPARKVS